MKIRSNVTALLLLLVMASSGWAPAEETKPKKKKPEGFSATVFSTGGTLGARSASLNLYIDSYTTDAEVQELAQALKTGGSDALLKTMKKMKRGRIAVVGHTGYNVCIVRSRPTEKGRRIIMVTDRPIGFFELRGGTRSRDYEFGIVELQLDDKDKGDGTLLYASKIKFSGDNTIELEHYGINPLRLVNVYKF